jgi:predicted site-specific integrase-resolvase
VACDPVGAKEIAARLGVAAHTVEQWKWRGLLPAPKWKVGGRDAWNWPDIARWAKSTGRT